MKGDEVKYQKLKRFNLIMGFLHTIQGMLMVVLSNDFTLPITRGFLKLDETTERLVHESVTIAEVRLGYLIALFLFISAIAHFLIATVLYDKYVANLKKRMNPYRWYEYSVSASIMIVAIAMLTGIYDVGTLLLLFFVNATMIYFGLLMEQMNHKRKKVNWTPFIIGSIAGIIPWIVIAIHLLGAGGGDGGPPDFVYGIYVSIAIFFNCFALNMMLQYRRVGKWKDYLYGERMYVILSLVAKSALAWQVFAGTLRPD